MKQILLLAIMMSLCDYVLAQENTWEVYLQGQAVKAVEFEDSYVWAATDGFLVRLNMQDKSMNYYPYPDIIEDMQAFLKIDNDGVICIACSETSGPDSKNSIYTFDGDSWIKMQFNEKGVIYSLAVDKNNNKWITVNSSLYKKDQDNWIQYTPANSGLVYDYISQAASDKCGNIWVANYDIVGSLFAADVALIKNDGYEWTSYLLGRGLSLMNLCFDSLGNPWLQQITNVQKLDTVSSSLTAPITMDFDNLYLLNAIEGEDKFWFIGNNKGIALYNGLDWLYYTTSNSKLPSDKVYQIAIDTNGTKWIGTSNGLAIFNEDGIPNSVVFDLKMMGKVDLFPNPAHDFITIKTPEELQSSTVEILNIRGEVIHTFYTDKNQINLDVRNFSSGVYLLRIKSNEISILNKFIKY